MNEGADERMAQYSTDIFLIRLTMRRRRRRRGGNAAAQVFRRFLQLLLQRRGGTGSVMTAAAAAFGFVSDAFDLFGVRRGLGRSVDVHERWPFRRRSVTGRS